MKTAKLFVTTLTVALLLFPACYPYFITDNFEAKTMQHQTLAILPFEMIYTGRVPEDLTEADLQDIEIAESKAFQISFYNEVLRSTRRGKKPIRIELQDYRKTLSMLEDAGMPITEVWREDPSKLAELLGVDALVRARIEKTRLMTDLESFGIELGIHILDVVSSHSVWPWLPFGVTRSKKVEAAYSLFDGIDGNTLWSIAFDIDADWRSPANEIIDDINRRAARKFPYRN